MCYQGNVTDPTFILIKFYIQTLHMQNIASQRFVSRHETTVASFDMGGSRPRFKGRPMKGSRLPHAKQSQGEIAKTSPSGPTRPHSEADRDVSTFSRSILTPSQTHRISNRGEAMGPPEPIERLGHLSGGGLISCGVPPEGSADPISK